MSACHPRLTAPGLQPTASTTPWDSTPTRCHRGTASTTSSRWRSSNRVHTVRCSWTMTNQWCCRSCQRGTGSSHRRSSSTRRDTRSGRSAGWHRLSRGRCSSHWTLGRPKLSPEHHHDQSNGSQARHREREKRQHAALPPRTVLHWTTTMVRFPVAHCRQSTMTLTAGQYTTAEPQAVCVGDVDCGGQ